MEDEIQIVAHYEQDTKRYHRYVIDEKDIQGNLYLRKGEPVPETVRVTLRSGIEDK